jgi:hypothetical protein
VPTERRLTFSDIVVEPGIARVGAQSGSRLAVIVELMRRNQKC